MSILRNILSVILLVSLTRAVPLLKDPRISDDIDHKATKTNYRLPTNVKPSEYTIKLWPNIVENDFTFAGESSIKIELTENRKDIILHAKDLEIDRTFTNLVNVTNNTIVLKPELPTINNVTDFLTLKFNVLLTPGNYILNLKYTGKLHDDLNGFYRSSYLNNQGEKVWLATTQFEPTHARRAFPCFDEPALKATFQISINHHKKFTAVSNMPLKNQEPDGDSLIKRWTHFKVTPVMSTYLIAFVVSDFQFLTSEDGRFNIWSRPNAIQHGHYAHRTGEKVLEVLDKYTGISHYSMVPKMDNFAIPQFRAGAMENWGIVTYRESALLYEENVTSTSNKQSIATVISHEFAHQWFGNLVSPKWWTYTWLNEGFATYFQYYSTAEVEDTWRLDEQFVIKVLQNTAFTADDNETQHAMNYEVNSPSEISDNFGSIAYKKAGSVIRMIAHALTEKVFHTGLKKYLLSNKGSSADSNNLFDELVAAAKATVKDVDLKKALNSWATQAGYPVITVLRNHTAGSAQITQHRFLTEKSKSHNENWVIPITYAVKSNPKFDDTKPTQWFDKPFNENITITGLKKGEWIIFNKQQTGYYRVNYDGDNWDLIVKYLSQNFSDIHILNRAQLVDDSFHLAKAGELSDYSVFLDVSTYLQKEVDFVPWIPAFRAFEVLNKALANTEQHSLFKLYILRLIEKLEEKVGYNETEEDDHLTKLHRINSIQWACFAGSKKCASATHEKLLGHVVGTSKISVDVKSAVLCAGIRAANATIWEKTFAFYEKSKDETERKAILTALGCSADSKVLNTFLAKSIAVNGTKISIDDAIKSVLAGSASGVDIAFDFINATLKEIITINGSKAIVLKNLNDIGSMMNTKAQVEKLKKFIDANKDLADELTKNALESANNNVKWIEKYEKSIKKFLDDQKLVDKPVTPKPNDKGSSSVSLPALQLILLTLTASVLSLFH